MSYCIVERPKTLTDAVFGGRCLSALESARLRVRYNSVREDA